MGLFGFGKKDDTDAEQEIIAMVNEGTENGEIEPEEAEMIANIFEYSDKEAADIMTHRNHIQAFEDSCKLKDVISGILNGSFSRFPVYHEDLDHICGILHLKDAFRVYYNSPKQNPPLSEIAGLLRNADFVPETRNIDELFRQMQKNNEQMVIVVDEYGQTSGLVAMEDILEEIVGNIRDEYDEENDMIVASENEQSFLIEGLAKLEDLEEQLGIDFGDTRNQTINGYLITLMEKIPEEGEHFETDIGGYHVRVEEVEDKKVKTVRFTKSAAT